MKTLLVLMLAILSGGAGALIGQTASQQPVKKKATKKNPSSPAPVSAATRLAARQEIERKIAKIEVGIENPAALAHYFAALDQAAASGSQVHVLQFGDSHTASDDWV